MNQHSVFRGWRERGTVWSGIAGAAIVLVAIALLRVNDTSPDAVTIDPVTIAIFGTAAIAYGLFGAFLYPRIHAAQVKKRVKRLLASQHGEQNFLCTIELRQAGAWVGQHNTEMLFGWNNATGIADTGDAVELRFRGAIVVARNRAFATSAERQDFLDRARSLAGLTTNN